MTETPVLVAVRAHSRSSFAVAALGLALPVELGMIADDTVVAAAAALLVIVAYNAVGRTAGLGRVHMAKIDHRHAAAYAARCQRADDSSDSSPARTSGETAGLLVIDDSYYLQSEVGRWDR